MADHEDAAHGPVPDIAEWPRWKQAAAVQAFERWSDEAKNLARLQHQVQTWCALMAEQLGCEPHIWDIAQAIPALLGDLDRLRDEVAALRFEVEVQRQRAEDQGGVNPGSE